MTLKAWSSTLLILCFSFAAWAQKGNSYLEKPLPQGWGTGTAHTIPGDDNLFGSQIQPVDNKWWKAFGDPMLDSLIAAASAVVINAESDLTAAPLLSVLFHEFFVFLFFHVVLLSV